MNQSNKLEPDQIKKLKSDTDAVFGDAEKELKEFLAEAQKLAKDLQQKSEHSE